MNMITDLEDMNRSLKTMKTQRNILKNILKTWKQNLERNRITKEHPNWNKTRNEHFRMSNTSEENLTNRLQNMEERISVLKKVEEMDT